MLNDVFWERKPHDLQVSVYWSQLIKNYDIPAILSILEDYRTKGIPLHKGMAYQRSLYVTPDLPWNN